MNVLIGSMFRDSAAYVDRYVFQIDGLRRLLEARGDTLRWVAVENDSADDTAHMLDERTHSFVDSMLVTASDGCPYYPSVDHGPRWRHHAWVQNHVLEQIDDADDAVIYVESDLVWSPDDLLALLDHLDAVPAATAGVFHQEIGARWYDSWGTTLDGQNFHGQAPWHPALATWEPPALVRVDTCASVLAVDARLAAKTRFQPEDAFKGWCRDIYAKGGSVWLDPSRGVVHP